MAHWSLARRVGSEDNAKRRSCIVEKVGPTRSLHAQDPPLEQAQQNGANELAMTSMGPRGNILEQWQEPDWQTVSIKPKTRPSHALLVIDRRRSCAFSDRHSDLTLQMINSVREVFGEQGLNKLIANREQQSLATYQTKLGQYKSLRAPKAKGVGTVTR